MFLYDVNPAISSLSGRTSDTTFKEKSKDGRIRTVVKPVGFWSQTCDCKKGTDLLKRLVEAQNNI